MYIPDNWVIVRIAQPDELIYKLLVGWSGGYLYGDSWRINSGITKVEEDGNNILFSSYSGSLYHCRKNAEGLRSNCSHILNHLQQQLPNKVGLINYSDFLKEFNGEILQNLK